MAEIAVYELTVNGESWPVRQPPGTTLLEVLRGDLALTGAKRGCNQGVCGACTVLLDGRPVRSCLTIAANVGERPVETVEGLTPPEGLNRVQQAMIDTGAVQCGFCTPGMVVAIEAVLRRNSAPSHEDLREAVSGNLCRCSGYVKILEAAALAAGMPA